VVFAVEVGDVGRPEANDAGDFPGNPIRHSIGEYRAAGDPIDLVLRAMNRNIAIAGVASNISTEGVVRGTLPNNAGIEYGVRIANLRVSGQRINGFRSVGELSSWENAAGGDYNQAHGRQAYARYPLKEQHGKDTFRERGNLFGGLASSLLEIGPAYISDVKK
jgi:hypothetical protein